MVSSFVRAPIGSERGAAMDFVVERSSPSGGALPSVVLGSGSTLPAGIRPSIDRPRSPPMDRRESILPRKEVIQPHLPVQLPCYDFVPVTDPTLGAYFPYGLAWRLQVLPTSMT